MIETKKRILLYCSTCKNFEAKSVIDESRTKEAIDRLKKAIDRLPEGDKRREQWRMFALPHLTKELKNVNPDAELCLKCTRKREEVVIDWSALAIAKRDMLSKKPRPQWRGQKLDMPCPACAKKALRALPTGLEWD